MHCEPMVRPGDSLPRCCGPLSFALGQRCRPCVKLSVYQAAAVVGLMTLGIWSLAHGLVDA